ncbi:MAG: 16S rRNA (cytidine(1402)-2'-O)-methyltransferase [Candidatus Kapaibacterium sp.]|nr:MAG: 16S rRNA (cytidine(1402)-2'-O)-methyltransferase [Candidatus Kapabacteria bacterium]
MTERLEPALYLVPVPIGNRDDITLRALKTLQRADIIASEDTRTTGQLLALYGITAERLRAYHDYNEETEARKLIRKIEQGKAIALVSEAGSPCISDPGFRVVQAAIQANIAVVPLPGATAFVPALSASGLAVDSFTFLGFPPHKKGRETFVKSLRERTETVILYESSHRAVKLLEELCEYGSENRRICIARELTKMYEEFLRGTVQECLQRLAARSQQKGEFVFILEGKEKAEE